MPQRQRRPPDPAKPNAGRRGTRWRKARAQAILRDGGICRHCGHPDAAEGDHWPLTIDQLKTRGLDPDDPDNVVASHGTSCPCPTCGRRCNQERGSNLTIADLGCTIDWYLAPAQTTDYAALEDT